MAHAPDHAIPERVRLVIALTEANSRHLSGESRRAGLEVMLAGATGDAAHPGEPAERTRRIALLREDMAAAEAKLAEIEAERERLYAALEALDAPGGQQ